MGEFGDDVFGGALLPDSAGVVGFAGAGVAGAGVAGAGVAGAGVAFAALPAAGVAGFYFYVFAGAW
nr:hypothetical protein [Myxococcota bacterium]